MFRFNNSVDGMIIANKSGTIFNAAVDMCIARIEGKELYGGIVYNGFTGASIQMHMAGFRKNWCNTDMLWVGFHYPFEQLGVKKLFGQVPLKNKLALKIDLKLGFRQEAIIKDVYPEGDMILLSMYKADCRWLAIQPKNLLSNHSEKEDSRGR